MSPTLRSYHQILWSKALPSGGAWQLEEDARGYLVHRTDTVVTYLASDAITTNLYGRAAGVIAEIPPSQIPRDLGYTIGSSILFPGECIGRQMTINGARGFHPRIADRFDLTLECIRLHYARRPSPLAGALDRYASFFELFTDLEGYVGFFLLQDLLDEAGQVRFFHPFAGFDASPLPRTPADYLAYRAASDDFIRARNARIEVWAAGL